MGSGGVSGAMLVQTATTSWPRPKEMIARNGRGSSVKNHSTVAKSLKGFCVGSPRNGGMDGEVGECSGRTKDDLRIHRGRGEADLMKEPFQS